VCVRINKDETHLIRIGNKVKISNIGAEAFYDHR
jgi:hypothetical protein